MLVHDYDLCVTGSRCCNVSYYNYISIHDLTIWLVIQQKWCAFSYSNMMKITFKFTIMA